MATRTSVLDRITIALFVAAISTPVVASLLPIHLHETIAAFETETPRPHWSWRPSAIARFPIDLQRYYNAHFGLRSWLMELNARLKIDVFGVSSSDRVTIGKAGWLFYAGEQIVADYRRLHPFSEAELDTWAHVLVTRRDWLRARGIPFVFLVVPNPQTIYPEFMPDSLRRADNPSRLEQLVGYLQARTDVDVIDLRPALMAAKPTERVYYKTDTHWNQLGGFLAYEELSKWMRRRFPAWRSFARADFIEREIPDWHGALAYFLAAPAMFSETRTVFEPREPGHVLTDGEPLPTDETRDSWFKRRTVVRTSDDGELASAVILRDSQFSAPAQFLSRHFRRSTLLWTWNFDPEVIDREHPDVVVMEVAERLLMNPVPTDPPLPPRP